MDGEAWANWPRWYYLILSSTTQTRQNSSLSWSAVRVIGETKMFPVHVHSPNEHRTRSSTDATHWRPRELPHQPSRHEAPARGANAAPELPRDRVGCILIVVEDMPDGMSHQRMATMGLGDEGAVHVLNRALENVARGGASKGTLVEIKPG